MARGLNIFHNLVTDENSTTELLCNLMQFAAFRRPLLALLLPNSCASQKISFDDIDTQASINDCGRPDIIIKNDDISAFVEVKVTQFRGLTESQPNGYFSSLMKEKMGERWLVFLVPKGWVHEPLLKESFGKLLDGFHDGIIHTEVVYWEDVLDVIEDNDLQNLNPFLNEFYQILVARFKPKPITFNAKEVLMLFNKNFPATLSKLDELIGQIQAKSTYKSAWSRERKLCPNEYGIYFMNDRDEQVLWFGMWTPFWEKEGFPLCFGVADTFLPAVRKAFDTNYKGEKKRFQDWTLGWISQETLADDKNAAEEVWKQIAPVVEAVVGAV